MEKRERKKEKKTSGQSNLSLYGFSFTVNFRLK